MYVVPDRGFEPRSPRLQRGAFTRLAYQASELARPARIELASSEWHSEAQPIDQGRKWWEVDGIEPLAAKGLRLQRSDGTSLSLLALPRLVAAGRIERPTSWL